MAPLAGHFWTIMPNLAQRAVRRQAPAAVPWEWPLLEESGRRVSLRGWWRDEPEAKRALILVHGLGGGPQSHYMVSASRAAAAASVPCLRLAMRGADRRGEDLHHAGLWADIAAALEHPALARFETLHVIGCSLGGHVALRLATQSIPRLGAVAAICAPLDLSLAADWLDEGCSPIYRRHILKGVNEIASEIDRRNPGLLDLPALKEAKGIREWDGLAVAPRFGFDSAEAYYRSESVARCLGDLKVPSLLVLSRQDPMIPAHVQEPALRGASSAKLHLRWLSEGGHVGFPASLDLGFSGTPGLIPQILSWFSSVEGLPRGER